MPELRFLIPLPNIQCLVVPDKATISFTGLNVGELKTIFKANVMGARLSEHK